MRTNFFLAIAMALLAVAGGAGAHTISIGYEPAGPGSLRFWYGSYHTYDVSELTEGTFTLVGINGNSFPSATVAFSLSTATKPPGLADGVTNFYASGPAFGTGPLLPTNTTGLPVASWQGVTFSGLQAGDYRFTYTPRVSPPPSAHWDAWNAAVQTNTVSVTGTQLGSAPADIPTLSEWALILLSIAVALVGFGVSRRRRST